MKKLLLIVFAFFIGFEVFAQSDIQLAITYFNAKEYEKAEVLFYDLYKQKKIAFYFDYYLDCLIFQEKFDLAERRINKEIRKTPNNLVLYVNLGYLYKQTNNEQEAEKHFKYVLKKLPQNKVSISQIGNTFIKRKEYEWAEKVYLKGNEYFENNYTMSLISVYSMQRNNEKLIDTYLDYIENDYSKIDNAQKSFKILMNNDVNEEFSNLLEQKLIRKIQKDKKNTISEVLIWFYTVKSEYSKALIHAKALDLKNKENGVRIYKIGLKAFENEDYNTSEKAYYYVVNKGDLYPYFYKAKFGLLKVLYAQVENGMVKTPDEIKKVESEYVKMINNLGISSRTIDLIIDLAHLQAFYLHKETDAIYLLQEGLKIPSLQNLLKAKFLLELGDVYLHSSMPWDAVLTYAKIEQNFPNLEITDNAKFRKAKVYFYLGQFKWAQDQWDVLKGSPSKLIANDAIYWSNFITENSDDSLQVSLTKYSRAEHAFYQGDYNKSLQICDSLLNDNSAYSIIPFTYHLKYEVYYAQKMFVKAAENLQKIADSYSYAIGSDKAVFELAVLYENHLNDNQKAKELYKKILFDYKSSIFCGKARTRFNELSIK